MDLVREVCGLCFADPRLNGRFWGGRRAGRGQGSGLARAQGPRVVVGSAGENDWLFGVRLGMTSIISQAV